MKEKYVMLETETINFDSENPRIRQALEKYKEVGDAEVTSKMWLDRIRLALQAGSESRNSTSPYASYVRLKDSIRAQRGISDPIVVVTKEMGRVCIDGNTRLVIYKELYEETQEDCWLKIKSREYEELEQREIEEIRMSAHLVGARPWPAYEKARYLDHLRHVKFMDYDEMIAICGGNKKDIQQQIDAYHDMEKYYRGLADDDSAFRIDRFSGFVRLQRQGIKEAIVEAGCELEDFGKWIRDGKIYRLRDVDQLPKVLRDSEAKKVFLEGDIDSIGKATRFVEQKAEVTSQKDPKKIMLGNASLYSLAEELTRRINNLPRSEWRALRDREVTGATEQIRILEDLSEQVRDLLNDVAE